MDTSHRLWLRIPALSALCACAMAVDDPSESGDYQATVVSPIQPPMLGIEMSPVPTSVQEQDGLTPQQGVYVQNTFNNTAASSMGVQPGDVVLQVNGTTISNMSDLRNEIFSNAVGDPVDVVVQRGGQQLTMNAPLQPWPADIPKERLDPAAEQRFRDWQADRQKQQQQQINDMAKDINDVANAMPADKPRTRSAADLDRVLDGGKQPWALRYQLIPSANHGLAGAAIAMANPAPSTSSDPQHPAWRFAWSNIPHSGGATP
jgi:hypothetical protein